MANSLQERRMMLGLPREALARILDVDPSSVWRHESARDMASLWDYALRGIEAEAREEAKELRRYVKRGAGLGLGQTMLEPEFWHRKGKKYLAYKMAQARKQRAAGGLDDTAMEGADKVVARLSAAKGEPPDPATV